MAQLVGVCDSKTSFDRRQMPLEESDIKMVVQFEKCGECEDQMKKMHKELDQFYAKCEALSSDELAAALMVTSKDVFNHLAQSVTCVGCRRSVEHLFSELVTTGYRTVEPLVVTAHSELSVLADIRDKRTLFCLFYIHGPTHGTVVETAGKGKSKKRCNLHSLDTHKVKSTSCWSDVWMLMSADCKAAVLTINCTKFEETLSSYLTKHRFCTECRAKVMMAYNILIGEHSAEEKGYCKRLFDKLQAFTKDGVRHLRATVVSDEECSNYLKMLINMAEPELSGMNRRDRHAKTLDIAQEEVLTCLGLHIYDKLHKIAQRLRQEEQTFRLLFSLGVETLKKSFEMAVESKQGVSNLERMCEEIAAEERVREQRREQKRLKKKRKKAQARSERENLAQTDNQLQSDHCECSSNSIMGTKPLQTSKLAQCDNHRHHCGSSSSNLSLTSSNNNGDRGQGPGCDHSFLHSDHHHHHHLYHHHHHSNSVPLLGGCGGDESLGCYCPPRVEVTQPSLAASTAHHCRVSDCGYSSELEGCDQCSSPSSNEGSDVCSDGLCMHEGEACDLSCSDCQSVGGSPERRFAALNQINCGQVSYANGVKHTCAMPGSLGSLEEMFANALLGEGDDEEDECGISEEDIQQFQANHSVLQQKRLELRENLKRRFENLQQRQHSGGVSPLPSPSSSPTPSPNLSSRLRHQGQTGAAARPL